MAGMINAAAGTNRRMKEMDEMTGAPPAPTVTPVAKGAVKKPMMKPAMPEGDMAPPPAMGFGSAVKRMLGFGAKR